MIPDYPKFSGFHMELRPDIHPFLKDLQHGISEFTFANLYLFRETHNYRISKLKDNLFLIAGNDKGSPFFMIPFDLPEKDFLDKLFHEFVFMKCVSVSHASALAEMGYFVAEDRNNFDYLYLREELVKLPGAKFHRKKNMVNAFISSYSYEAKPLLKEYMNDAVSVLDMWRQGKDDYGDYVAAKEALEKAEELQLCGGIYYVDGKPAAYTLGEELRGGKNFVIHFEKAVGDYKGLYQFVNQSFAAILPDKYKFINREQDLGDEGMRQAKMTYRPIGFVKKYRAAASAYILKNG
ncbi:MAG: DUF2156 domain-containing protein [Deltaproteobacteria bacterium]|nr:DUF2156 domain-containing protein [Deltaproteobacteria bacterium]